MFLQEHWCATWALRVALSAAAAGRLCSFRNTSTFSAFEIEFGICVRVHTGRKDRLSVAPRTFGSTPQGLRNVLNLISLFSVVQESKAYAPTDVPKTTPPGQCSCRNTGARLGRSYKSHAPQRRSEGYVPSGTPRGTALPLTPSRCIPIVEGRVNSPPNNHDSSVPAGTFGGFCT